jgi:hypothetical protein
MRSAPAGRSIGGRIPFKPQTIEHHQRRLKGAIWHCYSAEEYQRLPGLPRAHVFDLLINRRWAVRFTITRETHFGALGRGDALLHNATEVIRVFASGDRFCPQRQLADGYRNVLGLIGLHIQGEPTPMQYGMQWLVPVSPTLLPDICL